MLLSCSVPLRTAISNPSSTRSTTRVAERHLKLKPGMFLRQFNQQRRDALAAKQYRHGNAQAAADLLFPRFKQRFRTPNLLQRARAAFIKRAPLSVRLLLRVVR